MSGCGHAASAAARPSGVVMSQATAVTDTFDAARISSAVSSSVARVRATITRFTPSAASACAQPRPSPLLAAQTSAVFPSMPRSIVDFPRVATRAGTDSVAPRTGRTDARGARVVVRRR